jgi:hypothetical protein
VVSYNSFQAKADQESPIQLPLEVEKRVSKNPRYNQKVIVSLGIKNVDNHQQNLFLHIMSRLARYSYARLCSSGFCPKRIASSGGVKNFD